MPCLPPMSCLDPKSVLCRLLRVQSLGDVDFERLYAAYDDLVARFRDGSLPYDKMRWTHPHMTADWVQSDGQDDIRLVQRYRISSTARDCSIMIAFQRLPDDFEYYIHERETSIRLLKSFFFFLGKMMAKRNCRATFRVIGTSVTRRSSTWTPSPWRASRSTAGEMQPCTKLSSHSKNKNSLQLFVFSRLVKISGRLFWPLPSRSTESFSFHVVCWTGFPLAKLYFFVFFGGEIVVCR